MRKRTFCCLFFWLGQNVWGPRNEHMLTLTLSGDPGFMLNYATNALFQNPILLLSSESYWVEL